MNNTYDLAGLPEENQVLTTDLQWMTFFNYYSQLKDGIAETWTEACTRATNNLRLIAGDLVTENEYQEIFEAIYLQDVLPSMRLFSMPTKAIERCNTVIYNCSFIMIDTFRSIAEILYLTMSGVGVGYTVENEIIDRLPEIPHFTNGTYKNRVIADSQIGWADSINFLFDTIMEGNVPVFSYEKIRPAGTPLKTKGGVASGPEPLELYHNHVLSILKSAQGRKLTSIEVHDIVNLVSECAVSNGSRSGALICLFDDNDKSMLNAKSDPDWYTKTPWRAYSNNSVVVNGSTHGFIDDIVDQLIYDNAGEPGLFSRQKFYDQGRTTTGIVGVNPCGEVLLQSTYDEPDAECNMGGGQFCNLSTVITKEKTFSKYNLFEQIKIATLIGTIQSMATSFRFLRPGWEENTKREHLLGVCITGIYDYKEKYTDELKDTMRYNVNLWNKRYSKRFGIEASTSTTSVKPSGNTSALTNTSPGANPEFGKYQIRNVRVGKNSRMAKFLSAHNMIGFDDPFAQTDGRMIFSFPKIGLSNNTLQTATAQEQIDNYLHWANIYTSHNVSVTVTYKESEKEFIADWIKQNYKSVTGMAFFPEFDSNMPFLPVQVVTEEEYNEALSNHPKIDWRDYYKFEGVHEQLDTVECAGDRCDISY